MRGLGAVLIVVGVLAVLFASWVFGALIIGVGGILVAVSPSTARDPEGYDHPNARKRTAMDMRKLSTEPEREPVTTVDWRGRIRQERI